MRYYYVIHDQSTAKLTREEVLQQETRWREQAFAGMVAAREAGPNEQLSALKRSLTGEYRLGGIDLTAEAVRERLDAESAQIDARFKLAQRQLELVILHELELADPTRAGQLTVTVVTFGERDAAIDGVQAYLRENAALWYDVAG